MMHVISSSIVETDYATKAVEIVYDDKENKLYRCTTTTEMNVDVEYDEETDICTNSFNPETTVEWVELGTAKLDLLVI